MFSWTKIPNFLSTYNYEQHLYNINKHKYLACVLNKLMTF